uniref:Monocarboxylate transporter 13-like protein n=1 Tax=Callorhinchus milii TaxID=7868 RepID=V9KS15_CALMI
MRGRVYSDPPDGGWGWMVVFAGFLSNCLIMGVARSFGIFFLHFVHHFEETSSRASWVISIAMATQQFMSPVGSALGTHYGARPVVMVGGGLASLGLLIASFGHSLLHMYLSIGLLTGFGWSLVFTPTMSMIYRYFRRRRVLVTGLAFTGAGVSSFALSPLFQLMIDSYTWRGALQILSAIVLNLCVCGALQRPIVLREDLVEPVMVEGPGGGEAEGSAEGKEEGPGEGEEEGPGKREEPNTTSCWGRAIKTFDLTLLGHWPLQVHTLGCLLIYLGYFVPFVHLVPHAKSLGLSDYQAAFLLSATAISDAVGRIVFGWLADLKFINNVYSLWALVALSGLSLVLIPLASDYPGLMGLGVLFGFASGPMITLSFAKLPEIVGLRRVLNATGFFLMTISIGVLLGAPLSGWLEDITGSYTVSFLTAGSSVLLGLLVLLLPAFSRYCSVLCRKTPSRSQTPGKPEKEEEGQHGHSETRAANQ